MGISQVHVSRLLRAALAELRHSIEAHRDATSRDSASIAPMVVGTQQSAS
jgi:hypothetical protein